MISRRTSASFGKQSATIVVAASPSDLADVLYGPIFICVALFTAILANFIFRLKQAEKATESNPLSFASAWSAAGRI